MAEKYKPNGTSLTAWENEILTVLIEECAEVIQAATKLQRFGKENRPDADASPNTTVLGLECGDLEYMLRLAIKAGLVPSDHVDVGMKRKWERFQRYSQYMPEVE